jgi:hypothetical protein
MFCGSCSLELLDNFYDAQAAFIDGTMSAGMAKEEMRNAIVGWMDSECRARRCFCNVEGDRIVVRDGDDDVLFYGIFGMEFDDFVERFKILLNSGIDGLKNDYTQKQLEDHMNYNFAMLFGNC